MNKNRLATLLVISSTAISFSALAQNASQTASSLSSSTVANCTSYISSLAKDGNNGDLSTLSPQALQIAIAAAAGANGSDLTLCYQANACKDQLASQANCGKYLTLWNWYSTIPAIVKPQDSGDVGSTLAPAGGNAPVAGGAQPPTQMKSPETPAAQPNGSETGNQTTTPTDQNDPKKKQPAINWL